jgi:hypothetical protein
VGLANGAIEHIHPDGSISEIQAPLSNVGVSALQCSEGQLLQFAGSSLPRFRRLSNTLSLGRHTNELTSYFFLFSVAIAKLNQSRSLMEELRTIHSPQTVPPW